MVSFCWAQMADMLRYDLGSVSQGDSAALWLNDCSSVGDQPTTLFSAALRSFEFRPIPFWINLKPLQLLLFPHGVAVQAVGEGSYCLLWRCACVWVVVTLPHSYLSPSCVSSPPPLVCVFPALFLTLGTEEQKLLHYIDGESSPTLLTNAQCSYRILWSCILPEQEAVLFIAWFCCGSMLLTRVRKPTCKSE